MSLNTHFSPNFSHVSRPFHQRNKSYSALKSMVSREGAQDYHRVFNFFVNGISSFLFFDSGTASCYVSDNFLQNSNLSKFPSKFPIKLRGVGGSLGPTVNEDCLLTVEFETGSKLSIICGIVPEGTFPAPLTVERSVLHQVRAQYIPKSDKIQLTELPGPPILTLISRKDMAINQITTWLVIETSTGSDILTQPPKNELPQSSKSTDTLPHNHKQIESAKISLKT